MSDKKEIADTLKAAQSYLNRLKNLNNKIQNAQKQISDTSRETEKNVEVSFGSLLTNLTQILLSRKDDLIKRVQEVSNYSFVTFLSFVASRQESKSQTFRRMSS
jgi:hypothetical protein